MKQANPRFEDQLLNYSNRIYFSVAVVLVLLHLVFRFIDWQTEVNPVVTREWEEVLIEEIAVTVQQDAVPPPPRPRIAPPVISDEVIQEDPEWEEFALDTGREESEGTTSGSNGEVGIVENPDQPARVRRIVEAVTPSAARDLGYRVVVTVTLLVLPDGRVDEVFISQIETIDDEGRKETVNNIGYGIIEETIRAASGWLFIPAREGGEPVATYSMHRFTF
ncbi:MAG: hypothetical protein LAT84_00145 [Balneolia bacterium]|nr:hypothetical protein [Balneolia bacterium]